MYLKSRILVAASLATLLLSCAGVQQVTQTVTITESITSPGGVNTITFTLSEGMPSYRVDRDGEVVILPSRLGYLFKYQPPLDRDLRVVEVSRDTVNETWTQVWGEEKEILDNHVGMSILLEDASPTPRRLEVQFRAYDDGIAFRYILHGDGQPKHVEIMDEVTEFQLAGDHSAWWIPAYAWNRYEYLLTNSPVSELDTVHTPLTMETADGLFLSFHEAALTDFASMTLAHTGENLLKADLVPWSDGVKVRGELPMKSPWRTIQIGESAGDLVTSYLILNCNEPNKIEDTSWIEPGKYVGIWWGMHIRTMSWNSGDIHGATTENTKRYIDFASAHGFKGVLVEGWNLGWDGDWSANADSFSFTQPYPDYDFVGLAKYAREKGTRLIAHNETSIGILNYEQQMENAFKLYESLGINTIKSGYVGHGREIKRRDPLTGKVLGLEWHHGQWMVNHYRHVVETAAKYHLMLDVHEPIKDTGIRRTWPNMMSREGARGQEFNAWSTGGNPPDHYTILPFTRLLAGPFDYTPGVFDLTFKNNHEPPFRVNTTLAKQLANYVVIYSPLHMAADLVENYEGKPEFKFIEDVPTDWEKTLVLNGVIGDYTTFVRKDRNSDDWYLGSVTDENGRTLTVSLDFLEPGKSYLAEIYADATDADWVTNPYATDLSQETVTSETVMELQLAPGGGQAIRFSPAD